MTAERRTEPEGMVGGENPSPISCQTRPCETPSGSVVRARLIAVPCSVTKAREVVTAWHRHHGPSTSGLYAAAVATEDGVVRGVALIGRPVARLLDDGFTLEVTRVATDGTPNACSALYGIARRLGRARGICPDEGEPTRLRSCSVGVGRSNSGTCSK